MRIQQLTKKFKGQQLGRSMVEMLGVLAIIGVLSVGGVAGYRYAMQKIFENEVQDLFARIYQGVQSSMMNPNTYLNCCSGNMTETFYNVCSSDSGTWYTEQYDEICSFLSKEDCWGGSIYNTVDQVVTKSGIIWQYLGLRWGTRDYTMIGIVLSKVFIKKKFSLESLNQVCKNVLTSIVSNPVYQEKLMAIGPYRFINFVPQEITPEKIESVCNVVRNQYVSFSVYFKNDNLVDCIEEK